jgi:hypothetical protein
MPRTLETNVWARTLVRVFVCDGITGVAGVQVPINLLTTTRALFGRCRSAIGCLRKHDRIWHRGCMENQTTNKRLFGFSRRCCSSLQCAHYIFLRNNKTISLEGGSQWLNGIPYKVSMRILRRDRHLFRKGPESAHLCEYTVAVRYIHLFVVRFVEEQNVKYIPRRKAIAMP